MLEIKERQFEDFFQVPFEIYPPESNYISLLKDDLKRFLDKKKNPLFKNFGEFTYFTAYRDKKLVGRIVAHIHTKSNELYKLQQVYFGYFDCIDDLEVARLLLDRAAQWGRFYGCNEQIGAFNLTAMQAMGIVTEGFENAPYTDQVYNPPHIPKLLEQLGFEKCFPMKTFEFDLISLDAETILNDEHKKLFKAGNLEWQPYSRKKLKQQLKDTCDLLNDGFLLNPMFVPLTYEEFMFQAKDLMLIIDERISSIVYENNEPVGAIICIPDLNPLLKKMKSRMGPSSLFHYLSYRLNRKRAIVIFHSVKKQKHNIGLGATLIYQTIKSLKAAGYETAGVTWISDENKASLKGVSRVNPKMLHRLHLYKRALA